MIRFLIPSLSWKWVFEPQEWAFNNDEREQV